MKELAKEFIKETLVDIEELSRLFRNVGGPAKKLGLNLGSINNKPLIKHLSYLEFNPDNLIFKNKSTYGFLLKVSPFSGIDIRGINALTKIISYEIPYGATVQVINYASPEIEPLINKWQSSCSREGIFSSLSKKRSSFYLDGCKTGLWGKASEFVLRNFELYMAVSFNKRATSENNKELVERVVETRKKLAKALSNADCAVEFVDRGQLNKYLAQILFPDRESYSFESTEDVIQFTSDTEYVMFPRYVEARGKKSSHKYLLFEVDKWPPQWSIYNSIDYTGYFQTGRGIPFPFYVSFGFKADEHHESERKATKMRIIRTNQTTAKLVNFVPAMKEEMDDWHYITEEIDKGAKLAKAVMHIVAIIDSSIDEKTASQIVLDHFYQLGFKLNPIKYDCLNGLINTFPMSLAENWLALKRNKALTTMITSACLNLLPIFADTQNSNTPLMIFAGRRGQVFFFDNYASIENGNYNMVVVGKSGSGKSVFLQEYMTSILRQGGQVVVIDDGRSFQNSCKILEGDFIDFAGEDLCINPFSLYQDSMVKDEKFKVDFEEPLIDLIVSILCIVTNIDKNNTKNFNTGLYRDVLKKAVQIVLIQKGNKGGFKDVYVALKENRELRTEQTEDMAEKLAYILREYADGRYSSYYNGKATLSINNLLAIFELSSLESNAVLQTSVLLMVVFLVYVKMQGRERRTSLIIDEAWRLLRHDAIRGFIEGIARRARKYNGSLVVATQSISDFDETKSTTAAAVLSQSDWRVLLSAEGKDEKILKDRLGMEGGEIEIAKNLKGDRGRYSEFMIRQSSGSWLIGRLILDAFSAKLYSSRAEDVLKIQQSLKEGCDIENAIEKLIKEERYAVA
jgi:conjugal transfer ATP-binding protein TraC